MKYYNFTTFLLMLIITISALLIFKLGYLNKEPNKCSDVITIALEGAIKLEVPKCALISRQSLSGSNDRLFVPMWFRFPSLKFYHESKKEFRKKENDVVKVFIKKGTHGLSIATIKLARGISSIHGQQGVPVLIKENYKHTMNRYIIPADPAYEIYFFHDSYSRPVYLSCNKSGRSVGCKAYKTITGLDIEYQFRKGVHFDELYSVDNAVNKLIDSIIVKNDGG